MSKFIDLTDQRFTRWLVIGRAEDNKHGQAMWLCICDCGQERVILGTALRQRDSMSCGCLKDERTSARRRRHYHRGTSLYRSWLAMHDRCYNKNSIKYSDYGARGIKVCDRWSGEHGCENFFADMGYPPEDMTLDRYPDNDGDYEPSNCRWATPKEQANNTRRNRLITFDGRTQTLAQWSTELGVTYQSLHSRLKRWNGDVVKAFTYPYRTRLGGSF